MIEKKKVRDSILEKLRNKYRFVLLNDSTFKEVASIKLNRLNFILVGGFLMLLVIAAFWSAIAYTPLRELIPGYPDVKMRNDIIQTKIRLDSLELEIRYRDQYFANLNSVIRGNKPEDFQTEKVSSVGQANLAVMRSESDSILRHDLDLAEKLSIPVSLSNSKNVSLERLHFFTPVRGMVTNSFNPMANHFGSDVVAAPNEVVKATLDGTVTMASWTLETGHVIQIQHDNNLISVYKHNAELLKKVGVRVKAGDAIAIIGNSGELTTGPHLHFEIWQNGVSLNPEELIVF
ncbi:MAG: M23 family metallopeptidase [Bacteroidales bacterium]|nr:M23 family metallopeptidase [Bacteroidales bacterium]MCF8406073.1 M23 family metallopeptidase [Bacteroidales bacterium]